MLPPEIANLTGLKKLWLSQTQVSDLTPIRELTGLQALDLDQSRIIDFPPIREFTRLKVLSLSDTQVSDLTPTNGLTGFEALYLTRTRVSDLTPIRGLTGLQRLYLGQTQVFDLTPIRGLARLQQLDLDYTPVSDLRPLLSLAGLRQGPQDREPLAGLYFKDCAALRNDPTLQEHSELDDRHDRTLKVLDYLATLPPWPEPLPGEVPQGKATEQKTPKHLKRLSLSDARHILENNYPMVRDRCQAVVQEIDEGLAIQQTRIPNDERALVEHMQVTQSLTVAKAAMIGIYDALPEDFTGQEIDEETVVRFKQAFDAAIHKLQSAAAYIDRPDHTPTYSGLLKLGCAGSVASVLAIAPGVTLGAALPVIYALLYGPEAAKALKGMITSQTSKGVTEEG